MYLSKTRIKFLQQGHFRIFIMSEYKNNRFCAFNIPYIFKYYKYLFGNMYDLKVNKSTMKIEYKKCMSYKWIRISIK